MNIVKIENDYWLLIDNLDDSSTKYLLTEVDVNRLRNNLEHIPRVTPDELEMDI